jgi:hypothetical protein
MGERKRGSEGWWRERKVGWQRERVVRDRERWI